MCSLVSNNVLISGTSKAGMKFIGPSVAKLRAVTEITKDYLFCSFSRRLPVGVQ